MNKLILTDEELDILDFFINEYINEEDFNTARITPREEKDFLAVCKKVKDLVK